MSENVIDTVLDRQDNIFGHIINDHIPLLYMYNDNTDVESLDENYLIFYEIDKIKYIETGTVYRYKDNDGYGTYDFGFYCVKKNQYIFTKITKEIFDKIRKIDPYILFYYEFDDDDTTFDNTREPNKIYKQKGRKYCHFNEYNNKYVNLPKEILMEMIDIMIE